MKMMKAFSFLPVKFSQSCVRIRCPVDDTGMNSVIPSTSPSTAAFTQRIRSIVPRSSSSPRAGLVYSRSSGFRNGTVDGDGNGNGGLGRAPPLRSGSGCARRRQRYDCCQRRRAPGAHHPLRVPSAPVHARRCPGPAGAHPSRIGPSPGPPRSFLAEKGRTTPSGSGLDDMHRTASEGAPPLPASPPRIAGGRGEFDPVAASFPSFSLPHAVCGGEPGEGGAHHPAPSRPERNRILPFLPRSGGEGPGERGRCRAQ